jgi:hypothetical protein
MERKHRINALNITPVILVILAISSFSSAQYNPKTVTEFYLALPTSFNIVRNLDETPFRDGFFFDEFYENEKTTSRAAILKHRKALIKIEDIKNGYLKLQPKGSDGWAEIALFKKDDGNYLVALSQVECGPGCSGDLMFLLYSRGTWTNVTKHVFPPGPSSNDGYFKLPRAGTAIELVCGDAGNETCLNGKIISEFHWNREKFTHVATNGQMNK